jgi:GT2 family glycosyltransferase
LGHIEYYKNDKNLGYTANINKGIGLAKTGDVILLNSDTIVTRGWAEKLTAAAYSREGVATVTPLSNGAGAFSFPANNRFNALVNWATPEDYNEILEVLSNRKRPSAPTGNGFCMYITRAVLNRIKCFDTKIFPGAMEKKTIFARKRSNRV